MMLSDQILLLPGYDPYVQADGYTFDETSAQRAIDFIETVCKHAKGPMSGKAFLLEEWQKGYVGNLFGWKDKNGHFRYRETLLYIPKKNGKTALAAAITNYYFTQIANNGDELYACASNRDQASYPFQHICGMIRHSPALKSRLKVYGERGSNQMRSVFYEEKGNAFYKCLAADADAIDGAFPIFAHADEIHRFKFARQNHLIKILSDGMAPQPNALLIYTTTADSNRTSLCNSTLALARSVRDCRDKNTPGWFPEFLPAIWEGDRARADDPDYWGSEETWQATNPNYGVTKPKRFFQSEVKKIREDSTRLNDFLRLQLNIVTDSVTAWIDGHQYNECCVVDDPIEWRKRMLEECKGRPCTAAMDLSSSDDLTALTLYFYEDNIYLTWCWIPEDNAVAREKKDKVPYLTWVREGFIEKTPGDCIDLRYVEDRVIQITGAYNVVKVATDPARAQQIRQNIEERSTLEVLSFPQNYSNYAPAMKAFKEEILQGQMQHGMNPVLRWCVGNLVADTDANGNERPNKSKSFEKIDVAVSAIMAKGLSLVVESNDVGIHF